MSTPIVWVVQDNGHDYFPAEQFGEVRFITTTEMRNMGKNRELAQNDVARFIASYIPTKDYVVPSGNPVMVMSVAMAMGRKSAVHNILQWDARRQQYTPHMVEIQ